MASPPGRVTFSDYNINSPKAPVLNLVRDTDWVVIPFDVVPEYIVVCNDRVTRVRCSVYPRKMHEKLIT